MHIPYTYYHLLNTSGSMHPSEALMSPEERLAASFWERKEGFESLREGNGKEPSVARMRLDGRRAPAAELKDEALLECV